MNKLKTKVYADGKLLGSVPTRRGIFQGDSFSSLLFVIALLPLTHVLRETEMGCELERLERFITRMCQRNVGYADHMWRMFNTLSVVA